MQFSKPNFRSLIVPPVRTHGGELTSEASVNQKTKSSLPSIGAVGTPKFLRSKKSLKTRKYNTPKDESYVFSASEKLHFISKVYFLLLLCYSYFEGMLLTGIKYPAVSLFVCTNLKFLGLAIVVLAISILCRLLIKCFINIGTLQTAQYMECGLLNFLFLLSTIISLGHIIMYIFFRYDFTFLLYTFSSVTAFFLCESILSTMGCWSWSFLLFLGLLKVAITAACCYVMKLLNESNNEIVNFIISIIVIQMIEYLFISSLPNAFYMRCGNVAKHKTERNLKIAFSENTFTNAIAVVADFLLFAMTGIFLILIITRQCATDTDHDLAESDECPVESYTDERNEVQPAEITTDDDTDDQLKELSRPKIDRLIASLKQHDGAIIIPPADRRMLNV